MIFISENDVYLLIITANVSPVCEVAEKEAEYFLLPRTTLVKKDILLHENQQFRHKRC